MTLRNEKLVLSHLKEFGAIGQTEAMWYYRIFPKELEKIYKSLFMKDIGNGLILSKITETVGSASVTASSIAVSNAARAFTKVIRK